MRYLFVFCQVAILLSSCVSDTKKEETENRSDSKSLLFENQKITKVSRDCANKECAEVIVSFPRLQSKENKEKIDGIIVNQVNQIISDYVLDPVDDQSTDQLIKDFLSGYEMFQKEVPDSLTPWFLTIKADVSYQGSNFISFVMETSVYAGGAHPNNAVQFFNITKDGEVIKQLEYFVNDTEAVKKQAEKQFRVLNQLAPNQNLAEKGFTFDQNRFQLSDNYGFTKEGLTFYYNSYEIASYATGPTSVTVPFNELSTYLTEPLDPS